MPGILSIDSPHFIRTLGAAPAAYMLLGIGVLALNSLLRSWLAPHWYALGISLWFAALALFTAQSYFQVWASRPATAAAFEATLSEPARYLAKTPARPAIVFFPDGYTTDYPQVFQYLSGRPVEQVQWYDGNKTMALPEGEESRLVLPGTLLLVLGRNATADDFVRAVPGIRQLEGRDDGSGTPSFRAYQATEPARPWQVRNVQRLGATVGGEVLLEGYSIAEGGQWQESYKPWQVAVSPGSKLVLRVLWRPLRPAEQPALRLFFHLVDAKGRRVIGRDVTGYPSGVWRGGERILTWVELPLPAETPPGRYDLRVGAYSYADQRPLPVRDEKGDLLGDSAVLAALKVPPMPGMATPAFPLEAGLAGGPKLLGYDLERDSRALRVTLFWQAVRPTSEDYTVFLHLSDLAGRPVAQHDSPPADGHFPTSYWQAGDIVSDEHLIPLDPSLPAGRYLLRAGMYQPATGRRLSSLLGEDAITLREISLPLYIPR